MSETVATEPDRGSTTVTAPAKLTTSLRVVGRRADGYHLLDAEMVSIDLMDELEIAEPEAGVPAGISIELVAPGRGPAADEVPELPDRPRPNLPLGRDNLIHRALRSVGRQAHVRLVKRIPPGAGLGGGSSDAAAVLRWAGCDDVEVASSLGADVPFCLRGGRARVTGIGEVLTPLPFEPRTFTLLVPPYGCSTPAVYRAWDDLDRSSLGGGRGDPSGNDLQSAALAVEPRLEAWRDELARATGRTPRLAGSGSTWFVEGAFPGEGRVVVKTVPAAAVRGLGEDEWP